MPLRLGRDRERQGESLSEKKGEVPLRLGRDREGETGRVIVREEGRGAT